MVGASGAMRVAMARAFVRLTPVGCDMVRSLHLSVERHHWTCACWQTTLSAEWKHEVRKRLAQAAPPSSREGLRSMRSERGVGIVGIVRLAATAVARRRMAVRVRAEAEGRGG